jgi:hypothetical protein
VPKPTKPAYRPPPAKPQVNKSRISSQKIDLIGQNVLDCSL